MAEQRPITFYVGDESEIPAKLRYWINKGWQIVTCSIAYVPTKDSGYFAVLAILTSAAGGDGDA